MWISVKDKLPEIYDWVIVGHEGFNEDGSMTWTIGRYTPNDTWQFMGNEETEIGGAYCGDVWDIVSIDKITHWIAVPYTSGEEE